MSTPRLAPRFVAACLLACIQWLNCAAPAEAGPLEGALLTFEGRFEWHIDRAEFLFSDRPGLGALLEPVDDKKLAALIACIDDPRPARATLDDEPVTLGVMCYQALRQLAYVEEDNWPGHIDPLTMPADRTAAKQAWQAALAAHRIVLH